MRIPQFSGQIFTLRDVNKRRPDVFQRLSETAQSQEQGRHIVTAWNYPDVNRQAEIAAELVRKGETFISSTANQSSHMQSMQGFSAGPLQAMKTFPGDV